MRKHILLYAAFVAYGVLAGCATQAQREAQSMQANATSAMAARDACVDAVYASPAFAPLLAHIPRKPSEVTLQQKMDTSFVTDAEIQAILAEHPSKQACDNAYLKQLSMTHPTIAPILAAGLNKADDDLIALVQRKKKWGEYTLEMQSLSAETQVAVNNEAQRIQARLQQENQQELAQRQAAALAFAQAMQQQAAQQQALLAQQQAIAAANRPVYTNCNTFGTMTSCTSQ